MRRVRIVVTAAVCGGLLAGCVAETSDTPGLTESPTTSASVTPTPSPTAEAAGPRDLSDPELGVEFTDFPRQTDEATADAIQTYMLFEAAFWRAQTTNVVPPGPWAVATTDAVDWVLAQVEPNAADGWSLAGTRSTSIAVLAHDDATTSLDVCQDWTGAHFVNVSGETMSMADAGFAPKTRVTLGLINSGSTGWQVDSHELTGDC